LTLAFLEDTGHYVANYSNAGRIVKPSTNTLVNELSLFGTTRQVTDEMMADEKDYSPGWIRWGRGETCDFFTSQTKKWPEKYVCEKDNVGSCTPDNRMAAICRLVQYGSDGMAVPIKTKVAQFSSTRDYAAYSDTCWKEGSGTSSKTHCEKSDGGYPKVPTKMRPKSDDSGALGGWNSAMDFAAVPAGYWNCQDQQPASTSSNFVEGGAAGFNMGDIVGTNLKAMLKFGGQTRCPNCRCLKSSLREVNLGVDFEKINDKLGLCYRTNCATPNDLQIGVRGQFGTYWYDCPREGGNVRDTHTHAHAHAHRHTPSPPPLFIISVKFQLRHLVACRMTHLVLLPLTQNDYNANLNTGTRTSHRFSSSASQDPSSAPERKNSVSTKNPLVLSMQPPTPSWNGSSSPAAS
jgi:hypothetical protein